MKKILYIVLVIMWCLNHYAQNPDIKRTWHWYFGAGAGLDFSSGTAVADTTGKLYAFAGTSAISDTLGNLLFYTDGQTVWNKYHQIMQNGSGLTGYGTPIQSSIIIPWPNEPNKYYLFTVSGFENGGGLGIRYNIIDMLQDGGNGSVTQKNKLLFSPTPELIAATYGNDCSIVWLVCHERYSNCWRVYKIDRNGLDTIPIITCLGHTPNSPYNYMAKLSPDGSKLAVCVPCDLDSLFANCIVNSSFELYQFDKIRGTLSNPIRILVDTFCVALSFSPSSKKLFVYTANVWSEPPILQFDVTNWDSTNIANSKIVISNKNYDYGSMQISPNKKIILSRMYIYSVGIINYPDSVGVNCGLVPNAISLNGKVCLQGLPNFIDSYFSLNICDKEISFENSLISIPNIFTPNADNINDYFFIQIAGYKHIEYFIYNRWGTLIHQGKKELNPELKTEEKLWDGKIHKEPASDGVYYYILNLTNNKNEAEIKKGFVQLLR